MRPKVGQKRPLIKLPAALQAVPARRALEHDRGDGDDRPHVHEDQRGMSAIAAMIASRAPSPPAPAAPSNTASRITTPREPT